MSGTSRIGAEEVERIAHLARLRLSPEEVTSMTGDLDAILGYVDQLSSVDTTDVVPTAHAIPLPTPLREDRAAEPMDPELALGNAPAREGSSFAVPRVLDGEEEG